MMVLDFYTFMGLAIPAAILGLPTLLWILSMDDD